MAQVQRTWVPKASETRNPRGFQGERPDGIDHQLQVSDAAHTACLNGKLCHPREVPTGRPHAVQSQRDGPMSAQAIGLGHGTNPMNPKPQRGGPHSDTINRLEDARASNVGPPRWGFVGWSRPSPRPMAWAGIGLPRCGGRQTAFGWPRFKEPGCRRHRKRASSADSKTSVPMKLVINSRFPMLRTRCGG